MKFGFGEARCERFTSSRQIRIVCWSSAASSRTPQRRSMAWKRQPWRMHRSRILGKTKVWSALRSAFRSLKVELTKIRNVRAACAIAPLFPPLAAYPGVPLLPDSSSGTATCSTVRCSCPQRAQRELVSTSYSVSVRP